MTDALVISGAAAKGAFSAGAIAELLGCGGLRPSRVVGTSSGGLNAAYVAAYPTEPEGLVELWQKRAGVLKVYSPPKDGRGLSGLRRVRALVDEVLPRCGQGLDLRIALTDLDGVDGQIGDIPATTFERVARFDAPDFGDIRTRCRLVNAATACSALPIVFEPEGPLLDGGLLNNAPVKLAVEESDVDRIFVISAFPRVFPCRSPRDVNHLVEVILNERLYRDLRDADEVNTALRALGRFDIGPAVVAAMGWTGRRVVEIVDIRPREPLEGSLLSGFFDRRLRERYIACGREAARRTLDAMRTPLPEAGSFAPRATREATLTQ
jgi:predicted acylesterase/phospholipase RssA